MTDLLKDDLTVALDDVGRLASRLVTMQRDLAALSADASTADALDGLADERDAALAAFNSARQHQRQLPHLEDPERAHLQALWVKLKSAVGDVPEEESLREALEELDQHLQRAAAEARSHGAAGEIEAAMAQLLACPVFPEE